MAITYETHSKFLPDDSFQSLKNLISGPEFPWRLRNRMTSATDDDQMYFSYSFYNSFKPTSEFYEPYISPILNKLEARAPIQIRSNMFLSKLFKKSNWHRDYNFDRTSAILYLNDCSGGTELKIEDKIIFIKAEANKILVFDGSILHRAVTSEQPIRYILNFNYFTAP